MKNIMHGKNALLNYFLYLFKKSILFNHLKHIISFDNVVTKFSEAIIVVIDLSIEMVKIQ
jgi:hypothetical protein